MAKKIYKHGKFTGEEILTDEEHIQRQKDEIQRQIIELRESNRRASLARKRVKAETIKSYKILLEKIQSKFPNKLPDNLPDVDSLEQLSHSELVYYHNNIRDIVDSEWCKEGWGELWRNLHKTNWVWFFLIVFWPFGLYLLAKRILDKS